ncbi:hypothetical protein [uncultured Microbacterium sp.]|uniref:hypothetical protein n=1 Tax=uncultured Microbacterium sp. TaxID=191216 RepID=UPI0026371CA6|nr:hypothetical protein [uncultured Microbacterium sp.]
MTEAQNSLRDRVLHSDDDLRDMLDLLLQKAARRQVWVLFLDERGCLGDPLLPIADYPGDPHGAVDDEHSGAVTQAHLLMHRIGMMREISGNAHVVLAWERRGGDAAKAADAAWARAMADAAALLDVPLRAQFIVHSRGVRPLHADDYV